jgi:cation diffusion facilitator family transporter
MATTSSRLVVVADLVGGVGVAVVKFVVAALSGSSAMLSEGIHSLVDTGNSALLLLGLRLSERPPDDEHPFGYGLELYFWSLVVAVLIFGVGGGMSIYNGIRHLSRPEPLQNLAWNYVVLGCSAVFEAFVWGITYKAFAERRRGRGVWETIHTSKDPTTFTVLLENSAALVGLLIAFLGIFLSQLLALPVLDGVASILIGLLLAAVAMVLIYESRSLLLGEGADPRTVADIRARVEADPAVVRAARPLTLYLGAERVLVALDIQFRPGLTAQEVEQAVDRLEADIRSRYPRVTHIFLEAEALTARPAPRAAE